MPNTFAYTYDHLNRLTSGIIADSDFAERSITYDQAGNIQTLSRVYGGSLTDSLVYHYTKNAALTDQVQTIQDLSADLGTTGYAAGTGTYHYDPNGNINVFSSTNTAAKTYSTTYNLLNLPDLVHSTVSSVYEYDASGEKLNRIIDTNETDYISGIQYDNNRISFIQTEEGRVFPYSTDTSNYYQYFLADHLGNTRVAFDTPHDTLKVEQQDDYLPFGMEISQGTPANPKNEYLYNRKELQESTGLYDYGARFYDPVAGRWNTVDPLAEKSRRFSPYNYAEDNPIRFIDPDGLEVINADKAKMDAAAKNVAGKALSALGFGAKGGKNDLKAAVKSFKGAEKAFEHTEKSITTFKNVDPQGFKKADNLTYSDKEGNSHNLDVRVSTGDVADADKGSTTYSVNSGSGVIAGNALSTTIDGNVATNADVLAHEFGHGVAAAADPVGYASEASNAPTGYSCQDPVNRFNPISKSALDMQKQYDSNLRILKQVNKIISSVIP